MDNDSPSDPPKATGLAKFWLELKRRKVMRVAITYAVVAWLIIQIAEATFEGFGIPVWAFRFVTLMVFMGFPIAIILAWAFELTPGGFNHSIHFISLSWHRFSQPCGCVWPSVSWIRRCPQNSHLA